MSKTERLIAINAILATFTDARFVVHNERIYATWTRRDGTQARRAWVTREMEDYPVWNQRAPWGGTQSKAMSQLVRWWRGQAILPMATWEWWANDQVALCNEKTLAMLRSSGWPEHVPCVLCGMTPPAGLDWWNLDGVEGPCCSYFRQDGCRQKGKQNEQS